MIKKINYSDGFLADKVPFVLDKNLPWSKELAVDAGNLPVSAMDMPPFLKTFLLMIAGLVIFTAGLMVAYGFLEAEAFMNNASSAPSMTSEPLRASILGWLMVVFGLMLFIYGLFYISLRKSYIIGFRYVTVNIRNLWRQKTFMDALANYKAIRYRVFILKDNKPLYVIDIQHEDEIKSVPLYVSENGFAICKRISEYAKKFNLPVSFVVGEDKAGAETKATESAPDIKEPLMLSSRLVHFPWHIFTGSLLFFVLLDLIIFTSDWPEIMGAQILFGWLIFSSLLVFLLPLAWNYRQQEVIVEPTEVIVEDLLFNFISLHRHEIKNKDIVSVDISSFRQDKNGLIINSCNEAVVVGYGAPTEQLNAIKKAIEKHLKPATD